MRIKIRGGPPATANPLSASRAGSLLSSREPACATRSSSAASCPTGATGSLSSYLVHGVPDRRQPSLRAMEEIAWVLRSDPKKNTIGFVKRAELTRRERFVLDDDEFSQDAG